MCCEKKDSDWVKKCMEYEVEGSTPRDRPERTWREVVQRWDVFETQCVYVK